jgi:CheY-like chemotaxis protein
MEKILLVEDYLPLNRLLCDSLEDEDYRVDCVGTAAEAYRMLDQGAHDLAIVDVHLPDGSGYDIADRALKLGIETVILTGRPDQWAALRLWRVEHSRSHSASISSCGWCESDCKRRPGPRQAKAARNFIPTASDVPGHGHPIVA